MPFRDPSRLVWIPNIGDNGKDEWRVQVAHFRDVAARSQSLANIAGYNAYYSAGDAVLATEGETRRLTRVPVSNPAFRSIAQTRSSSRSESS